MTTDKIQPVSWDDLLKEWGIASWQLQRLITNPNRRLLVAQYDAWRMSPYNKRCPPIRWTEEEFIRFVGKPSKVYFDRRVVDQFRDENPDLVLLATEDCSDSESGHDWSEVFLWKDLLRRWGFLDELQLFQRFLLSSNRLVPCWWSPDRRTSGRVYWGKGLASMRSPDWQKLEQMLEQKKMGLNLVSKERLSDLLFCKKHVEAYERQCYKEFPNNINLALKYESVDKQVVVATQPMSVTTSGIKQTTGLAPIWSCPTFFTAEEWESYRNEMIKIREDKYTDRQAHYWRSRAVFRYLNLDVNKGQATKLEYIKKCLPKIYRDIIQFGCEQAPYDLSDVEEWITSECPNPENYDKKPKPWESPEANKTTESQMRRKSRLRECVQAIGLIVFSQNRELTNEAFTQTCSQKYLENILDSVGENSLPDTEAWQLEEKNIRVWVRELIRSIRPVSGGK